MQTWHSAGSNYTGRRANSVAQQHSVASCTQWPMGSSIQWRAAQWGWRCSPSIFSWGFVFLIFKGKMSRVWSWIWRYCSGFFAASWETIFSSRAEQELSKKNLLTTIGGLGNGESPFRWWIYATLWVAIVYIHFAPRYLSTGVRALDRVPGLGTEHLRPTSRVLVSTAIPTSTSLHQTAGHILCVERSEVWTLKIKVRLLHLSICRIPVKIKVPEPSLQIFYSSSCLSYWWLVEVGGMAHCNRTPSTFDPAGLESHSQASCQNVTGWFESLTILVLMVDSNYPSTVDFFDNIFTFINELVMLSQMRYLAA